jgi:predicted ATP-grasp superfamily ATP-dependent carboligase
MRKALILGSGFVVYGAIRALGLHGIQIIHISSKRLDFARFSKFVHKSVVAPSASNRSIELLSILINLPKEYDGALILPTDDDNVVFVSKNRNILAQRYVPAPQDWKVIGKIIDKKTLYIEAQKINIPTPDVFFPESVDDIWRIQNDLSFPCILKPYQTPGFKLVFKKKVLIIKNFKELVQQFRMVRKHNLDVMISEIIPGADNQLFHYRSYIDDQGEILAEMCTQKLRQHPPGFGMACAAKTIPIRSETKFLSQSLLKHLGYQGESSVEFKFDQRDNQYKLMEINVRPVLPESHFIAAGINFPYITYMDLVEKEKKKKAGYKNDIYWINNITDAWEFLRNLNSKNFNFIEFFYPYRQRKVFCIPFFSDPLPLIMISLKIGNLAKSMFKKLFGGLIIRSK